MESLWESIRYAANKHDEDFADPICGEGWVAIFSSVHKFLPMAEEDRKPETRHADDGPGRREKQQ
jgi:hypothetical protein